jgi:hypothetical protein
MSHLYIKVVFRKQAYSSLTRYTGLDDGKTQHTSYRGVYIPHGSTKNPIIGTFLVSVAYFALTEPMLGTKGLSTAQFSSLSI